VEEARRVEVVTLLADLPSPLSRRSHTAGSSIGGGSPAAARRRRRQGVAVHGAKHDLHGDLAALRDRAAHLDIDRRNSSPSASASRRSIAPTSFSATSAAMARTA
jgi:hypothetical protein